MKTQFTFIKLALAALFAVCLANAAQAATVTWTGGSSANANWGTAANWTAAPGNNDTAQFGAAGLPQTDPTVAASAQIATINFISSPSVTHNIVVNSTFTLQLNANGADSIVNNSVNAQQISGAGSLKVQNNQNWNAASGDLTISSLVNLNGKTLTIMGADNTSISGIISGSGAALGIAKNDAGTLTLSGINTYSQNTAVNAGKLIGVTGGSAAFSKPTVSAGATLGVQVASPGGQWTWSDVTLANGSSLNFDFGAAAPSTTTPPLVFGKHNFTATIHISVQNGTSWAVGTYPLFSTSDMPSGDLSKFTLDSYPPGLTATIQFDSANKGIDLVVSAVAASAYKITDAAAGSPTAGVGDQLTIKLVDQYGNTVTSFNGDKTLTFSGLSTAGDGTLPTVTDKTGAAVNEGTATTITFASGVSSVGGSLKAYKAETQTLNVTDGTLLSTSTGGAGVSLTIANAAPVATDLAVTRTAGTTVAVAKSSLANQWSDANHDVITLASVSFTSTNGITVSSNANFIVYPNTAPNVNDQISYTISDGQSTVTGHINITVTMFPHLGQSTTPTISGNTVTLKYYGIANYTYVTQMSTNSMVSWSNISTNTVGASGAPFYVTNTFSGTPPSSAVFRLAWYPQ